MTDNTPCRFAYLHDMVEFAHPQYGAGYFCTVDTLKIMPDRAPPIPEAQRTTTAWMPIETAPQDGTVIDLWVRPYFGKARRYCDYWWLESAQCWRTDKREDDIPISSTVTHWMPRPATPTTHPTDNTGLIEPVEPCPFCGNKMTYNSGRMNKVGFCDTDGCWMHERKMTVPLDDPKQVAGWNVRAALATKDAEIAAAYEACAKAADGYALSEDKIVSGLPMDSNWKEHARAASVSEQIATAIRALGAKP